ncbi:MAG: NlpC/P60 family protein [Deltaproteobacteria bacterium]|nr:NlpC/P60 family protein [Deltaproteobacteria bacterium]
MHNIPIISAPPPSSSPVKGEEFGVCRKGSRGGFIFTSLFIKQKPPVQRVVFAGDESKRNRVNCSPVLLVIAIILWCTGCGGPTYVSPESRPVVQKETLAQLGYSVQVGAFANQDNAVRLSEALERYGLDAYYFVHETGLYKVRFGDFPTKEAARRQAEHARAAGIIDEYWIVSPDDYAVQKQRQYGSRIDLRDEIVGTAKRFIGTPYRWGGTSPDEGFDCSGLTMVVYQLNGLKLPRSSRQQYRAGIPIGRDDLMRGDLVFFATSGGSRISHVGIYVGKGRFIHAPGRGKKIRTSLLQRRYYRARYVGARTYLR